MRKKAQLDLGSAPTVVLLIGLVFLVMATLAFIGEKYGTAVLQEATSSEVANESGWLNSSGYTLDYSYILDFSPTITVVLNATDNVTITSGNYSVVDGVIYNNSATVWNPARISYTYTYSVASTAYNTTGDLQTELSNNTSIAGIVLTISLVGIVLTILIGVFVGMRRPRI